MDENLSENKANEINNKRLIAFVRETVAKSGPLAKMPWIRALSELVSHLRKL